MQKKQKNHKLFYLITAIFGFVGLGLELVVVGVETLIYGSVDFRTMDLNQVLIHWTITCALWVTAAYLIYRFSISRGFNPMEEKGTPNTKHMLLALLMLAFSIGVSYFSWDMSWKPMVEYLHKVEAYGDGGTIAFIMQYVYYIVESILILITVVYGQKFGEAVCTHKYTKMIPWGGIFCAFTWGFGHIFTKNVVVGMLSFVGAILFGVAYLAMKKNIRYAYPLITLMFML